VLLKPIRMGAVLLAATAFIAMPLMPARAQPGVDIPPSVSMEHDSVMTYLQKIAVRTTPSGAAAQRLMEVLKQHMALEDAFILPPLTLLPTLARGIVSPDMRWAIPMSDRVRTEHDALQRVHNGITEATLALQMAADDEHDEATIGFCRDLAADDLNDMEVTEPTVMLIGDLLRSRLPAP
jgi:hypothetical protein